jgi:hypothetical protein
MQDRITRGRQLHLGIEIHIDIKIITIDSVPIHSRYPEDQTAAGPARLVLGFPTRLRRSGAIAGSANKKF